MASRPAGPPARSARERGALRAAPAPPQLLGFESAIIIRISIRITITIIVLLILIIMIISIVNPALGFESGGEVTGLSCQYIADVYFNTEIKHKKTESLQILRMTISTLK